MAGEVNSFAHPHVPGRLLYGVLAVALGLIVLGAIVCLPFAAVDFLSDADATMPSSYALTRPAGMPTDRTRVDLQVNTINEVQGTISVAVSGFQICNANCQKEQIDVYSLTGMAKFESGLPPSSSLVLPASGEEVSSTMTLPLRTQVFLYPFDTSRLVIGLVLERIDGSGQMEPLPVQTGRGALYASFESTAPRVRFSKPAAVDPRSVRANATLPGYIAVDQVYFTRYLYLKMLVVFIVLLVAAAVAYAVFLRPLDQIIGNTAGIVLGVWGVRNLLLNGYPPDTTAVDVILEGIVFLLLIFVSIRAVNFMRRRAGWGRDG